MMLKVLMEFRRGVLFVRLYGIFNNTTLEIFNKDVKEVIISSGIKYVVLNMNGVSELSSDAIRAIKRLRKIITSNDGDFFLISGEIKELKKLVKLENELNVFERVVI